MEPFRILEAVAAPLIAQDDYIREPFGAAGIDPAGVFYFGESVLLPESSRSVKVPFKVPKGMSQKLQIRQGSYASAVDVRVID